MKQSEFETRLRTALHTPASQSLPPAFSARLRQEMKQKRRFEPVGFAAFLKLQIKFIGWKIWLFQAILLALLLGAFWNLLQVPFWNRAGMVSNLLCGFALLVSAVVVPVTYRSFCYRMHEVEATTYFSAPCLLLAKLIVVGLGDCAMLLGVAALAAAGSSLELSSAILYVLVPFLAASCGILHLMGHAGASRFLPASLVLYGLLGAAVILIRRFFPWMLRQELSVAGVLLIAGLAGGCLYQLNRLLQKPAYAELQLM